MSMLLLLLTLVAKPPRLDYSVRIDSADLTRIHVQLVIHNAPANLTLAAHAHPEYDDKYWRYITDLTASGATVTRAASVLWKLNNAAGNVTVRYTVGIPAEPLPRAAWKPFLSNTGGLIGGPHSFLYVVGSEQATTSVRYELPAGWRVATSYRNGMDVFNLMESPMLVGHYGEWTFNVGGVPHRVAYWRKANSTTDTIALVRNLEKLARSTFDLFGGAPYREYTFVYQDDAWGGLEHPNMMTLGTPAMEETAHEFFHTWNLMHFKPLEYRQIDYKVQPPVTGLWFAEGLTIFYSDVLQRRAGVRSDPDYTRLRHVQGLLTSYLNSPGNYVYSAETISKVAYNASPGALGDYSGASSHRVGEVIGTMLDLVIRDATNGARSMDDVMRLMNTRFGGRARGYTSADIEAAVGEVCTCSVKEFFDAHVRDGGKPVDFNKYLRLIGLQATVSQIQALQSNGQPAKDLRIWASERGDGAVYIHMSTPESIWGRAGLHTDDKIVTINGTSPRTWPEFRTILANAKLGDMLDFVVERAGRRVNARVVMSGYQRPDVVITKMPGAERSRLLEDWLAGR